MHVTAVVVIIVFNGRRQIQHIRSVVRAPQNIRQRWRAGTAERVPRVIVIVVGDPSIGAYVTKPEEFQPNSIC